MVARLDTPKEAGFVRVDNRTLHHQVLEQIRNAIVFGQLPVGTRLREVELASRMGVSRVPIREALRQLERESLVQTFPHRGTVVSSIDDDEVEVLYRFRSELEAFAVKAVVRSPEACQVITRLNDLLESMRAGVRSGDLFAIAEHDLEFHRTIVAASGYKILGRVWRTMDGPIRARVQRALNGPFREKLVSYTAESHLPIVEAIASGDAERAAGAVKEHILETRKLIEAGLADEVSRARSVERRET
jgi:DNA-binding GntR family transcriptional regulator